MTAAGIEAGADRLLAVLAEIERSDFAQANGWVRDRDPILSAAVDRLKRIPITVWLPDHVPGDHVAPYVRWAAAEYNREALFLAYVNEAGYLVTHGPEKIAGQFIPYEAVHQCDRCGDPLDPAAPTCEDEMPYAILPIATGSGVLLFAVCRGCIHELKQDVHSVSGSADGDIVTWHPPEWPEAMY